jgi:hypothetical protein
VEVRCFHFFEQVRPFADALDELNRLSRQKDPFSTFAFLANFFAHNEQFPRGRGLQLWFLIAFEDERAVGFLPLRRVPLTVLGIASAKLEFLVTHDNDRPHLVSRPEDEHRCSGLFYRYLLSRGAEWSVLEFQQQDASSPLTPPPLEVKLGGYRVRTLPSRETSSIAIEWPTFSDYFQSLSKKFRSNVSRQMRSLFAAGEVTFCSAMTPSATSVLFELLRTIEPRSWKTQASANIGRSLNRLLYYRGLLDPRQPMQLQLSLLMLDGIPIAGLICGEFENALYALHIIYDASLDRLAPGSAVMLMAIRAAVHGGYRELNLLSGYSYYKARWRAQQVPTFDGQLFRFGTPLYWKALLGELRRGLPKRRAPTLRFNPARRKAIAHEPPGDLDDDERQLIRALLRQLRLLPAQWLRHHELQELMPFVTRRPEAQPSEETEWPPRRPSADG